MVGAIVITKKENDIQLNKKIYFKLAQEKNIFI